MASKFASDRGFEEERFEFPVSENFKCSICLNVLNNPKSCRNNQHYFCSGCIGEHLKNSHTCPECMEELTPATLVQRPRVLLNCILELRIKCVYSQRGCPEHVQLGRLKNHVDECGFEPAQCENEGCGAEVNRGEKVRHETELCQFRKVECYGCGKLLKQVEELRRNQRETDRKLAEVLEDQLRMKDVIKEVFKDSLGKVESVFNAGQSDCPPPRVVLSHRRFEPKITRDIFVIGGRGKDRKLTNSVDMFSSKEGRWVDVARMSIPRSSASSVVFDNQVIVSGGCTDTVDNKIRSTDSIEILNLDKCPLKWNMSDAKLPFPMSGHQTFVYKGKLIVVFTFGILEKNERGSDIKRKVCKIFQVSLSAPYATKELHTLPTPVTQYKAELVNEKIFLFGGSDSDRKRVLIYDLGANEYREMPGLPTPVCGMSVVRWGSRIILLGGIEKVVRDHLWVDQACANVTMYDTETGESEMLHAMKHPRRSCSAVVTDDAIVVMGGHYNSVEFYDFRTNIWRAFKVMKETRFETTAVVSPL